MFVVLAFVAPAHAQVGSNSTSRSQSGSLAEAISGGNSTTFIQNGSKIPKDVPSMPGPTVIGGDCSLVRSGGLSVSGFGGSLGWSVPYLECNQRHAVEMIGKYCEFTKDPICNWWVKSQLCAIETVRSAAPPGACTPAPAQAAVAPVAYQQPAPAYPPQAYQQPAAPAYYAPEPPCNPCAEGITQQLYGAAAQPTAPRVPSRRPVHEQVVAAPLCATMTPIERQVMGCN
jgi:hypothetical protein